MKLQYLWAAGVLTLGVVSGQAERQAPPPSESKKGAIELDPFAPDKEWLHAPQQILVMIEWIEMEQAAASKLLLETPMTFNADALRDECGRMIEAQTAKLLETSLVIARSGQKATTESIRERIYPTEYEPWELPQTVALDEEMKLRPADLRMLASLVTPATPTAFETRNCGATAEVEATVAGDARTIDLRLAPEIVWEAGMSVYAERKDPLGNMAKIEMPVFYSLKVNTSLTVLNGHHFLTTVQSPKNAEGLVDHQRKVLVFVRCNLQLVTEPPKKKEE